MPKVLRSIASAGVVGVGTLLLRPADWWPWARWAYVLVPGSLAGLGAAVVLFGRPAQLVPEDADAARLSSWLRSLSPATRGLLVLAFPATLCVLQEASLRSDASIESWLSRRGSSHPRRWMGLLAALATLASDLDRKPTEPSN